MGVRVFGYRAAYLKWAALPGALLLAIAAAPAAVNQQALFEGYVGSPAYRGILQKAYNTYEPAVLKAKCPALTVVSFDKPEILEPIRFEKSAGGWAMRSGAWVARATLDRCGSKVLRRALVESAQNNMLKTQPLLPGEFAGGYRLEGTAKSYVIASMINVTECKDWKSAVILDIKLRAPVTAKGWIESWTGFICGKLVSARVDYTPNGPTTDIVPKDIIPL